MTHFAALFLQLSEPASLALIGFVLVGLGVLTQALILASRQRAANQSNLPPDSES
jgi:hypothetical protein